MQNIPLYMVRTAYGEESGETPTTIASAKNYARALDSSGIPATIYWVRTITIQEYLNGRFT